MTAPIVDELLTVEQMAELLHTSTQGVYALQHRGRLPRSIRVGRRRLYPRGEVDRWIERQIENAS